LDALFLCYHRREYVHPDPLETVYAYGHVDDREIAAFIASALAYGRVQQILKSVHHVLKPLTRSPKSFLLRSSKKELLRVFAEFRHRFTTGEELAHLLYALKKVIEKNGSLRSCFEDGLEPDHPTVFEATARFADQIRGYMPSPINSLLPCPRKGSSCKRLNLFLRWMVRKDNVDPGGWDAVPPAKLIIPLDTHMHRIGLLLDGTRRKQADMRTALDITTAFRTLSPEDPVRYDFALTRLGIHPDTDLGTFLDQCGIHGTDGKRPGKTS
jgi:uncharacterized protein (TIGR02757 family)